jgi:hypothetical protein
MKEIKEYHMRKYRETIEAGLMDEIDIRVVKVSKNK